MLEAQGNEKKGADLFAYLLVALFLFFSGWKVLQMEQRVRLRPKKLNFLGYLSFLTLRIKRQRPLQSANGAIICILQVLFLCESGCSPPQVDIEEPVYSKTKEEKQKEKDARKSFAAYEEAIKKGQMEEADRQIENAASLVPKSKLFQYCHAVSLHRKDPASKKACESFFYLSNSEASSEIRTGSKRYLLAIESHVKSLVGKADKLVLAQKYQEAIDVYLKAMVFPNNPKIQKKLANAKEHLAEKMAVDLEMAVEREQYQEARDIYLRIRKLWEEEREQLLAAMGKARTKFVEGICAKAHKLADAGKIEEAIALYELILAAEKSEYSQLKVEESRQEMVQRRLLEGQKWLAERQWSKVHELHRKLSSSIRDPKRLAEIDLLWEKAKKDKELHDLIPPGWTITLWKACWNAQEGWLDFTVPTFQELPQPKKSRDRKSVV